MIIYSVRQSNSDDSLHHSSLAEAIKDATYRFTCDDWCSTTVTRIDLGKVNKAQILRLANGRHFAYSQVTVWEDGKKITAIGNAPHPPTPGGSEVRQ
jgi:hypothetical protein